MNQKFKVNSVCRDVVKKEQVMEWRIAGCNEASSYLIDPFSEDAPPAHIIRSTEGLIDGKKWSVEAYVERISIQESEEMKHNVRLKFFVNDDGKCPNNCYQFEVEYDDFSERSYYLRNSSGSGRVLKSSENDPLLETGFGIKRWKPETGNCDSLGNPIENEDEFTLTIWCMKLSFDVDTEREVEKSLLDDTDLENGFEKVDITAASSEISVIQNEATDEETEHNNPDEAELVGASISTIVNQATKCVESEKEAPPMKEMDTQVGDLSYEFEDSFSYEEAAEELVEEAVEQNEDKAAVEPVKQTAVEPEPVEQKAEESEPQQNAAAKSIRLVSPVVSGSETYEKVSNHSTASRWTDDSSDDEEEFTPDQKTANAHVVKRIRKIYLVKMKQIAETSSRLLVTAARVSQSPNELLDGLNLRKFFPPQQFNFAELLSESCRSLGAQMTSKNFVEIWQIAKELKADELKEMVIKYVVENRERLTYDESMTSDLMLEVVRAIG